MKRFRDGGLMGPNNQSTEADLEAAIIQELLEPLDAQKYGGPKGRIYCYKDRNGSCPAREFLDALPTSGKKSYAVSFTLHCNGLQVRGVHHHIWEEHDSLGAYKHRETKTRIVHTWEKGNIYVLLFGFGGKKENAVDSEQVSRAIRMQAEYKQRRDEIESRVRKAQRKGR